MPFHNLCILPFKLTFDFPKTKCIFSFKLYKKRFIISTLLDTLWWLVVSMNMHSSTNNLNEQFMMDASN